MPDGGVPDHLRERAAGALRGVPGFAPDGWLVTYALPGGLSNEGLVVETADGRFAVRLPSPGWIRLDRDNEIAAHRTAARAGLAPAIVYADAATGLLVTRWLPGRAWTLADMHAPGQLVRIGALLKSLWSLPPPPAVFDDGRLADRLWARYVRLAAADGAARSMRAAFVTERSTLVAGLARADFCHFDLVAANILDDGRLRLVDFEYAAAGDRWLDVAMLCAAHDHDETEQGILLRAAGLEPSAAALEKVARLRRLADFLAAHWYLARSVRAPGGGAAADQAARLVNRLLGDGCGDTMYRGDETPGV